MGFPIPPPINKLVTIATKLPSVLTLVKTMGKTDKEGNLGIVLAMGQVAAGPVIAEYTQKAEAKAQALGDHLEEKAREVGEGTLDGVGLTPEEIEEKQEQIAALKAKYAAVASLTEEEVAGIVKAEIEKIKPPIIAALAPVTAVIGIPIFLMELLEMITTAIDPTVQAGLAASGVTSTDPQELQSDQAAAASEDLTQVMEDELAVPNTVLFGTPPDTESPFTDNTDKEWVWDGTDWQPITATSTPGTGTPTPGTGTPAPGTGTPIVGGGPDENENENPFFDDEYMKLE